MIVKELIAELQRASPLAKVTVSVALPDGTASTTDVSLHVTSKGCRIEGWADAVSDGPTPKKKGGKI